jgi:two-component system OmpR family response regulator
MNSELLHAYLVEDNPLLCECLASTLEDLGCIKVVGTARGESQAQSWLHQHPHEWQLLVVDLFLRHGSGLHLIEHLPARRPWQKVLVFSNYVNGTVRQRCRQMGVDAVFDKASEGRALVDYCARQSFLHAAKPPVTDLAAA